MNQILEVNNDAALTVRPSLIAFRNKKPPVKTGGEDSTAYMREIVYLKRET
jgi:hypothetical protein